MNLLVLFIFVLLGLVVGFFYLFGKNKFSPVSLLISLWLVAIGISQLRLSPYELPFSFQFWLVLIGFLLIFYFSSLESSKWWDKIKEKKENYYTSDNFVFIILFLMTLALSLIHI